MTGAVPVITPESPELALGGMVHIATELISAASWNARKTMDRAALDELQASIEQHGIQVPLIVRLISQDGYYEVVAGHRRLAAACNVGLKTVPCIVRQLTDDHAREIGLVDNLQREDVPAMEEAVAFGELLGKLQSIANVAARVGKEQSYVAQRLKLCSCSAWVADALRAKLITVDHALLLARLGADEQDEALKWTLDTNAGSKTPVEKVIAERTKLRDDQGKKSRDGGFSPYKWEPESVLALKTHLEREGGILLSRAPWSLDEPDLIPDAAACSACPQNTKANAPLFGDLEIGAAKCTDGGCWREKTQAFVQIKLREAATQAHNHMDPDKGQVLRVSWKATSTAPRFDKADKGAQIQQLLMTQVFKHGQWLEIGRGEKKKCEHTRQAVTVDWSDANDRGYMGGREKLRKPGEIVQVCVEPKCKLHPKEWAKPKRKDDDKCADTSAEQAKLTALRADFDKYEPAIRETIFDAICQKIDPIKALLAINDVEDDSPGFRKELLKLRPKLAGWELEAVVAFANHFADSQNVNSYYMVSSGVEKDRAELWGLAKKAGVDADQVAAARLPDSAPADVREKLCAKAIVKKAAKPTKIRKPVLSAAARKRIAEAQQKRWKAQRATAKKGGAK